MLENWTKPQIPETDELEERLSTARAKLSALQMQIKEHGLPVLVLFLDSSRSMVTQYCQMTFYTYPMF